MSPQAEAALSRPRVEGDREAEILAATLEVLADVGYDRLTMDAVALRAKASKATLYRRWNDKVTLVIDALVTTHKHTGPVPDTGNLRDDLVAAFCGQGGMTDQPEVAIFGAILTAVTRDAEFAQQFRERILADKVARTFEIFQRARARGEVGDHVDLSLVAPALPGIVLHRVLMLGERPSPDLVMSVVDQIIIPAATRTA